MHWRVPLFPAVLCVSIFIAASCGTGDDDDSGGNAGNEDDSAPGDDTDDVVGDDAPPPSTDPDAECAGLLNETAKSACHDCVLQCNLALQAGYDLSAGPCISEAIIPDWTCDATHSPRLPSDDYAQNRCIQYPDIAHHMIEVTPECRFLTAI